jgi:hypothetical protein
MTETSNDRRPSVLRLAAAAVVLASPLLLSGCFPKPDVSNAVRLDVPATDGADVEIDDEDVAAGGGLSFADGASLTASSTAEWGDGMVLDDDWTLTSPDDGNGNWGYTSADGSCTVAFWQGSIGDVDTSSGDDRIVSDEMLATLLSASDADIAEYGFDTGFAYQIPGNDEAEARAIVGDDGTTQWIMAARALSGPGLGFTVTIDCTGGDDPEDVLDDVNELSALIVTP